MGPKDETSAKAAEIGDGLIEALGFEPADGKKFGRSAVAEVSDQLSEAGFSVTDALDGASDESSKNGDTKSEPKTESKNGSGSESANGASSKNGGDDVDVLVDADPSAATDGDDNDVSEAEAAAVISGPIDLEALLLGDTTEEAKADSTSSDGVTADVTTADPVVESDKSDKSDEAEKSAAKRSSAKSGKRSKSGKGRSKSKGPRQSATSVSAAASAATAAISAKVRDRERQGTNGAKVSDEAKATKVAEPTEVVPITPDEEAPTSPPVADAKAPTAPAEPAVTGEIPRVDADAGDAKVEAAPKAVDRPVAVDSRSIIERPRSVSDLFSGGITGRRRLQARKVRRVIRHIDPWSVLTFSVMFHLCLFAALLLASALVFNVAEEAGTIENVESFIRELGDYEEFEIDGQAIFKAAVAIAGIMTLAASVLVVLLTVMFNLLSDLLGGVRITVIEEETLRVKPKKSDSNAS